MRKKHTSIIGIIGFSLLGIFTIACKKDNPKPDDTSTAVSSYIRFTHNVNQQAVVYDTVIYTNDFGNEYSIETIRYFITNVAFVKSNGDVVKVTDAIYVDPRENGYDKKKFTKAISNGEYTEMRFTFGLDSAMNKTGLFNNFPEAAMEWPVMMGGGYHYMKLEGKYEDQGNYNHFNFHTGPLNKNLNYFQVSIPMNLSVTKGSFDVTLAMEIQNWFKNPTSFDLTQISAGMMGNQAMQELVKENGNDVFMVE